MPVDKRLGAQCLAAIALHKAGRKSDPRIREALVACEAAAATAGSVQSISRERALYSHGLAIILLSEVNPRQNRSALSAYLSAVAGLQKPHGGWGYQNLAAGDTSQTQYIALGLWQAHRAGVRLERSAPKAMIKWLCDTQDPTGAWGYQGRVSDDGERVPQVRTSTTMGAAAMASLMIGADLHGSLGREQLRRVASNRGPSLPKAARRVQNAPQVAPPLPAEGVDWRRVSKTLDLGEAWMATKRKVSPAAYPIYYLYSLERYYAFQELSTGETESDPRWYRDGYAYLESKQKRPGVWEGQCGEMADTAFAVLFLLRATQKSIKRGLGEGAMVSGRGLPRNVARARFRGGQVVADTDPVGVDAFLSLVEKRESDRLDALASDPGSLVVGDINADDLAKLDRLMRAEDPSTRLVVTNALGESGTLDAAPSLIYGLSDPDRRVALAARDGLRFLSRRPRGFGMPDEFDDDQRYRALDRWRRWYVALRPEAVIDLGR
ncbi:MAG: hypothetical protein AAF805_03410 [Planctomycetota bacterium]